MKRSQIIFLFFLLSTITQLSGQHTAWLSTITAEKSENDNHIELNWAEEDQTTFTIDRNKLGSNSWERLSADQAANFCLSPIITSPASVVRPG